MPLSNKIPERHIRGFHLKLRPCDVTRGQPWWWTRIIPTLNMVPFWFCLEIPRNSKIMSSFVKLFCQNFGRSFIGLPPLRFLVLMEFTTRDENSLFTVQVQFRSKRKRLFEVNFKTRRHWKYQRLQKSSFKHVISHVQFVLALKVVLLTLMTFQRQKF